MRKMSNTFYIFNAGCIRRGLDCIRVKKYLIVNGWRMSDSPKHANLIIVSTCGVVKKNEEHSLKALQKAYIMKEKGAKVVVMGCLPEIDPLPLMKIGELCFVTSGHIESFDDIVNPKISIKDVRSIDSVKDGQQIIDYLVARSFCRRSNLFKKMFDNYSMNHSFLRISVYIGKVISAIKNLFSRGKRHSIKPYYNIKIADGCLSSCTYCATQFATGKLKSRALEEIVSDFKIGLDQGYKYFQLISEDTGCYGLDIGVSITVLLKKIFEYQGDFKLILIDFNPYWLIQQQDELIPLLAQNQNRVKELFIPFQSGSNTVLGAMKREYTSDGLIATLKRLRQEAPDIAIRTCAIVGFPGESDLDFEATKRIIEAIDFAEVTINRYEDRPKTSSSIMAHKIPQEIIESRAQDLVEHCECKLLS